MKTLTLSNGKLVKVDDEDYDRLKDETWHPHSLSGGKVYAARRFYFGRKRKIEYLHHAVLGVENSRVRFINGDPFDCQKANLDLSPGRTKSGDAGAIGEAAVLLDLTKHGHSVYVPMAGHCAADLISRAKQTKSSAGR